MNSNGDCLIRKAQVQRSPRMEIIMVKLLVGVKGTGKTKKLIEMVGTALESSKGNVVVVEKGNKLIYSPPYSKLKIYHQFSIIKLCHLFLIYYV